MPRGQRDAPQMNALAKLIQDRMSEKGWSTYDVQRKGGPPARTVAHLADPHVQWRQTPRPATLTALAHALEITLGELERAAAQAVSSNVQPSEPTPYIERVTAAMANLTPRRQEQIADLVARMIDTWKTEDQPPLRAVADRGRRKDAVDVDAKAAAERKKQQK